MVKVKLPVQLSQSIRNRRHILRSHNHDAQSLTAWSLVSHKQFIVQILLAHHSLQRIPRPFHILHVVNINHDKLRRLHSRLRPKIPLAHKTYYWQLSLQLLLPINHPLQNTSILLTVRHEVESLIQRLRLGLHSWSNSPSLCLHRHTYIKKHTCVKFQLKHSFAERTESEAPSSP